MERGRVLGLARYLPMLGEVCPDGSSITRIMLLAM